MEKLLTGQRMSEKIEKTGILVENLGWDYYHAMAFGGLFFKDSKGNLVETDSFMALIPNSFERKKIINILANEEQANSNSKGEKC